MTSASTQAFNPPPLPQLLTIDEVAEYLRVTRHTIYKYTTEGRLQSIKVGGRHLFRVNDLAAFVDPARSGSAAPSVPTTDVHSDASTSKAVH